MVTLHAEQPDAPGRGELLESEVIAALRTVCDPEIPVNIYDLGLVYDLHIDDDGNVAIRMTLTTPACPVAESMPGQVERTVREVPGVRSARVELVWEPPWTRDRLDLVTRMELGLL